MGNGAKAQQKRERNAKDTSNKGSQLKSVRTIFQNHDRDGLADLECLYRMLLPRRSSAKW